MEEVTREEYISFLHKYMKNWKTKVENISHLYYIHRVHREIGEWGNKTACVKVVSLSSTRGMSGLYRKIFAFMGNCYFIGCFLDRL